MQLSEILKDSDYRQSQFNPMQINELERRIIVKAELITQSFMLRRESKKLLVEAKEMVEREIEKKENINN